MGRKREGKEGRWKFEPPLRNPAHVTAPECALFTSKCTKLRLAAKSAGQLTDLRQSHCKAKRGNEGQRKEVKRNRGRRE